MKIDPAIFDDLRTGKLVVFSAYALSSSEKEILLTILKKLGKKSYEVEYQIVKSILAGVVLKIGSTLIDLSLLGQLENLKQELYENT